MSVLNWSTDLEKSSWRRERTSHLVDRPEAPRPGPYSLQIHSPTLFSVRMLRPSGPTRSPAGLADSSAAFVLKASAVTDPGRPGGPWIRWRSRSVRTRVLPEPAGPMTRAPPVAWLTAASWSGAGPDQGALAERDTRLGIPAVHDADPARPSDGGRNGPPSTREGYRRPGRCRRALPRDPPLWQEPGGLAPVPPHQLAAPGVVVVGPYQVVQALTAELEAGRKAVEGGTGASGARSGAGSAASSTITGRRSIQLAWRISTMALGSQSSASPTTTGGSPDHSSGVACALPTTTPRPALVCRTETSSAG